MPSSQRDTSYLKCNLKPRNSPVLNSTVQLIKTTTRELELSAKEHISRHWTGFTPTAVCHKPLRRLLRADKTAKIVSGILLSNAQPFTKLNTRLQIFYSGLAFYIYVFRSFLSEIRKITAERFLSYSNRAKIGRYFWAEM